MKLKHLKFIVFMMIASTSAFSLQLPENHAVNGGITIIPLDTQQKPEVFYDNHRIAVTQSTHPNQWIMVVGVPLENTQPIQELNILAPSKTKIPFHISDKFYKTQYLTIQDIRKVIPLPQDQERIDAETKQLQNIFSSFTQNNPFDNGFNAPAHASISSQFGLNRVYNKEKRPPHMGLDIAAPENTMVQVVSSGKVVEAGDYFYTGHTVIVDHGMGVFSLYGHLNQMNVKKGDIIKKGHAIGTVGKTGRATGPHLHWGMIINEAFVDPLLFVPTNKITSVPTAAKPSLAKQ